MSVISMAPCFHLVLWAQCCYRDQQSDHCTSRTCFPERWTKMRMYVGHLNIGQCFPIFLLKSQEREALHALSTARVSLHQTSFLPFTKHPFLHLQQLPGTISQGALCRQVLQTPMSSCSLSESWWVSCFTRAPTRSLTCGDCR